VDDATQRTEVTPAPSPRGPRRLAGHHGGIGRRRHRLGAGRGDGEGQLDLLHGQPRLRRQHLGHLRSEHGRLAHDLAGRAVGHDLPVGEDDDPVGELRDHLDVVGGQDDGVPGPGELVEHRDEPLLGLVVETAGGLVEQHQRWGRGEDDGQHEPEPLALAEVAGVHVTGHVRHDAIEHGPGGARCEVPVAVRRGTLLVDPVVVEQDRGVLGDEPHQADALPRVEAMGLATVDGHPPPAGRAQAHHVAQQRGLARAVAAHEREDLAAPHVERHSRASTGP
jgi:hypothetical protein